MARITLKDLLNVTELIKNEIFKTNFIAHQTKALKAFLVFNFVKSDIISSPKYQNTIKTNH